MTMSFAMSSETVENPVIREIRCRIRALESYGVHKKWSLPVKRRLCHHHGKSVQHAMIPKCIFFGRVTYGINILRIVRSLLLYICDRIRPESRIKEKWNTANDCSTLFGDPMYINSILKRQRGFMSPSIAQECYWSSE